MSEESAREVLIGTLPMPEDITVEQVFHDAHVTPSVVTPF